MLDWAQRAWGGWAQRAQTTRQTGGAYSGALSTVHIEDTDNQSNKVHTVGHYQLYIQWTQTISQTIADDPDDCAAT